MAKYNVPIEIDLTGENGNAFFILAKAFRIMKDLNCTPADIKAFEDDATSSDYEHLLKVVEQYFDVKYING